MIGEVEKTKAPVFFYKEHKQHPSSRRELFRWKEFVDHLIFVWMIGGINFSIQGLTAFI